MDDFLTKMFNTLPVSWQPYVVLFLIVAYVVTKWRSNLKSDELNDRPKSLTCCSETGEKNFFGKMVEFMF